MSALHIVNGRVYDPANDINGEMRDIAVTDGKIVASPAGSAKRIDANGMVVMPGGVDIHAHIAGPKVNLARKLQPEDHRLDTDRSTAVTRSGTGGIVPSTFSTGYRYTALGYTTVMEAAVPPLAARHVLEELHDLNFKTRPDNPSPWPSHGHGRSRAARCLPRHVCLPELVHDPQKAFYHVLLLSPPSRFLQLVQSP